MPGAFMYMDVRYIEIAGANFEKYMDVRYIEIAGANFEKYKDVQLAEKPINSL